MPTRTSVLARANLLAGVQVTLYTVPANETDILKSCQLVWVSGANTVVAVIVVDVTNTFKSQVVQQAVNIGARFEWSGFVAAQPGDTIQALSTAATVALWITGAKLPGVA